MIDKALLDEAWETVREAVRWTPLLHSDYLDSLIGARVYLKAESLQIGGSFKMRGAYFRVSCLSQEQRSRGVVAFSSGNFAQALALAGPLVREGSWSRRLVCRDALHRPPTASAIARARDETQSPG